MVFDSYILNFHHDFYVIHILLRFFFNNFTRTTVMKMLLLLQLLLPQLQLQLLPLPLPLKPAITGIFISILIIITDIINLHRRKGGTSSTSYDPFNSFPFQSLPWDEDEAIILYHLSFPF